jgi:tyrosyl-tRNA synthetase
MAPLPLQALADFDARFRQGAIPDDIPEVSLRAATQPLSIAQVLKQAGLTASTSEALRMIEQGGVRIDGCRVDDKQPRPLRQGQLRPAGRQAQVRAGQHCLSLLARFGFGATVPQSL